MDRPIGIFDSGVGGLTVASAIKKALPKESFVYFGDTRHSPYGEKSKETILRYSQNITEFLLSKDCKAIVIACNTASALAFEELRTKYPDTIILNVVDPVVDFVAEHSSGKVGIIATRATTQSGIYQTKLLHKKPKMEVVSQATPLLVGLVEEGFMGTSISQDAIKEYLRRPKFESLSSLILGCTHFPLLQKEIEVFYQGKTKVVDSPELVAQSLFKVLKENTLLSPNSDSDYSFYVSEKTEAFQTIAQMFFGGGITLEEEIL